MSRNLARDVVNERFDEKQDRPTVLYGYLGDEFGNVVVPNRPNYNYVRTPDGNVTVAYNVTVPTVANLPVVLGYDPLQRDTALLKVLSVRSVQRFVVESSTVTPNVSPHHATHEWLNPAGGQDPVYIDVRQMMPLRPAPESPYKIYIARGLLRISGHIKEVGGVTVDLAAYVPQTPNPNVSGSDVEARYALISVNGVNGSMVVTTGTQKSIWAITLSDIPSAPYGNIPVCAALLYMKQSQIYETGTRTDLIDLRWNAYQDLVVSGSGYAKSIVEETGYYLTAFDSTNGNFTKKPATGYGGWIPLIYQLEYIAGSGVYVPGGPVADKFVVGMKFHYSTFSGGSGSEVYGVITAINGNYLTVFGDPLLGFGTNEDSWVSSSDPAPFPSYFNWSGSASNPQGFTAIATDTTKIWARGRNLYMRVNISGSSGSGVFSITLPAVSQLAVRTPILVSDNGGAAAWGLAVIGAGSSIANFYTTPASGSWTASGNRAVYDALLCYLF